MRGLPHLPETATIFAFHQWREARSIHHELCDLVGVRPGSDEDHLGREGAFFLVMGGFTGRQAATTEPFPLAVSGVRDLIMMGLISSADSQRKEIIDKGRASWYAKLLVCAQVSWMVAQCIVRKVPGLPVALLELHVVVQVFFSVLMYGFWWYKPLDAMEPVLLFGGFDNLPSRYKAAYNAIADDTDSTNHSVSTQCSLPVNRRGFAGSGGRTAITEEQFVDLWDKTGSYLAYLVSLVVFSTYHATAWNLHFPTPLERLLWRISCIIVSCAGAMMRFAPGLSHNQLISYLLAWTYLANAGYLLVESFISLRSPPNGMYSTPSYIDYIPHL